MEGRNRHINETIAILLFHCNAFQKHCNALYFHCNAFESIAMEIQSIAMKIQSIAMKQEYCNGFVNMAVSAFHTSPSTSPDC